MNKYSNINYYKMIQYCFGLLNRSNNTKQIKKVNNNTNSSENNSNTNHNSNSSDNDRSTINELYDTNAYLKILSEQLFDDTSINTNNLSIYDNIQNQNDFIQEYNNINLLNFSFDPLLLENLDRNMFVNIVLFLLKNNKSFTKINIDEQKLIVFLVDVGQLYYDALNPYHNIKHALHVFHTLHMMMIHETEILKDDVVFSIYISALCHDIDHCGCTNSYLAKTQNKKAILSNYISPQEMHHARITIDLLEKHQVLIGSKLENEIESINQYIIYFILATNISDHNKFMIKFNPKKYNHRLKLYLKCADLSHTFASEKQHITWTEMLQKEFFIQGDKEHYHRIPVTAMFDRKNKDAMKFTQYEFFNLIVRPMFNKLFKIMPENIENEIAGQIEINVNYWRTIMKTISESSSSKILNKIII